MARQTHPGAGMQAPRACARAFARTTGYRRQRETSDVRRRRGIAARKGDLVVSCRRSTAGMDAMRWRFAAPAAGPSVSASVSARVAFCSAVRGTPHGPLRPSTVTRAAEARLRDGVVPAALPQARAAPAQLQAGGDAMRFGEMPRPGSGGMRFASRSSPQVPWLSLLLMWMARAAVLHSGTVYCHRRMQVAGVAPPRLPPCCPSAFVVGLLPQP